MKAYVAARRHAGPEGLELRDREMPAPREGEVLVRIHAASLNDWEWGLLQPAPPSFGRFFGDLVSPKGDVLGCDIAGVVQAAGPGVTELRVGDEVYGDLSGCGFGAFAEYARVPAGQLVRKPAAMSFEEAASLPQAGVLAMQGLLDDGKLQPGQKLLVNGAGGGVGTLAIQIAKQFDAHITAVDRADKLPLLGRLGAHEVIDYQRKDFTESNGAYDLILDVKTNRPLANYRRVLAPGGRYVTVGGDLSRLLQAAVLARGFAKLVVLKPNKDLAYLAGLFESGRLRPVIDRVFPFEQLRDAFRRFGAADHQGKIVVRMA
jgi:NADPH:quinone reductase-like Zn-dependent oxidoreductase